MVCIFSIRTKRGNQGGRERGRERERERDIRPSHECEVIVENYLYSINDFTLSNYVRA